MKTCHVKPLVTWLLAGVFSAVSLAGPALHSLLGIEHRQRASAGKAWQESGSQIVDGDNASRDEAGCPICNYLALGKVIAERFEGVSVTLSVPNQAPQFSPFLPITRLRPFQPRAPPPA